MQLFFSKNASRDKKAEADKKVPEEDEHVLTGKQVLQNAKMKGKSMIKMGKQQKVQACAKAKAQQDRNQTAGNSFW